MSPDAGVASFADIAKNADKFDKKIYGIEPGAPANQNIQKMITAKQFGLDGWTLVESSEQGMLSQVTRAGKRKDWIVFLAWEPHPMNTNFDLVYLSGGDEYFGANYGASSVYTITRKGYAADCPNVAKLMNQLTFNVPMENTIMGAILDNGSDAKAAAKAYLKSKPELILPWLAGVTTQDGQDGDRRGQKAPSACEPADIRCRRVIEVHHRLQSRATFAGKALGSSEDVGIFVAILIRIL